MNNLQPMPPFVWQSEAWSGFIDRVNADRLPHAILLRGERGAEPLARALALFLLCRSPIETVACGKCKDCELYIAGAHPDFYVTRPEEGAKQIKVDQVRDLTDFVAKTAQRERRKIVLIYPAGAMNTNSANALLKCLEEPAGDTVFLLVQEEQKQLLPTIRSRCSVVDLKPPSRMQALEWLTAKGVDEPDKVLEYANGSPLLAWEWVENESLHKRLEVIRGLHNHVVSKVLPLKLVASWKGLGIDDLVNTVLSWVEILIKGASQSSVPQENLRNLFKLRDSLLAKKRAIGSGANPNEALLLEEIAIDLQWLSGKQFV